MDLLNFKIGIFFINILILFLNNNFNSKIEEKKIMIKINPLYIKKMNDNIVINPSILLIIHLLIL